MLVSDAPCRMKLAVSLPDQYLRQYSCSGIFLATGGGQICTRTWLMRRGYGEPDVAEVIIALAAVSILH